MKKRLALLILVIVLILSAIVAYLMLLNKPSYLKEDLPFEKNDGKLLAIIQIGGLQDSYDYSLVDKYFNTRNFETIDLEGEEKYLIIPRDCEVKVYSLSMGEIDEETLSMEEKYIKSMTEPFYITCNISDIISNSLLRVVKGEKQYSYSPYISLKDGSLVIEEFVLHIQQ